MSSLWINIKSIKTLDHINRIIIIIILLLEYKLIFLSLLK